MSSHLEKLTDATLFWGLTSEQSERVLGAAREIRFAAGQTICRQGDHGESMYIILDGHVRICADRGTDRERCLAHLGRGEHFGEVSVLAAGPRTASATAVIDTELLEVHRSDLYEIIGAVPQLAANLGEFVGACLRKEADQYCQRACPKIVGLVRTAPVTDSFAMQVVGELIRAGVRLSVFTERGDQWTRDEQTEICALPGAGAADCGSGVREQLMAAVDGGRRVLIDAREQDTTRFGDLLTQAEQIWWLTEPRSFPDSVGGLHRLLSQCPSLQNRLHLVWLLADVAPPTPVVEHGIVTAGPDIRVACLAASDGRVRLRAGDVARLVHRLQGVHIGLALGGGGARGMTHVGVLRAFENAGIYFDRLAGTSIGALVAAMYAAGFTPDEILSIFERDMKTPRWLQAIPGGNRWRLWAIFRFGLFAPMVRRYATSCTFEQLLTPVHTVSVDLIAGRQVVRESGDVISAIVESFNIPGLAGPILRDGQALVDGGVLNNLPADVLRERDADLVVAVNVSSKLPQRLGHNSSSTPTSEMRRVGLVKTMLRVVEVQQRGLASLPAAASDFLIEPDASGFDFDDFNHVREMADVGQSAAERAMPQLQQMLAELDTG